ncbi:RNA polymerase sigma-54 factor [Candidatus Poribacteria bacterium]|nr:RNA polymerase sigma-54 factor [Candidatus Poribacteria bacterium]
MNLGLNQSISQRVEQKLQFKLSQKMQQAIKMLLMSRLDLTQHLTQQLEENPFLDEGLEEDLDQPESSPDEIVNSSTDNTEKNSEENVDSSPVEDRLLEPSDPEPDFGWEDFLDDSVYPSERLAFESHEDADNRLQDLENHWSLQDFLLNQIDIISLSERERQIGSAIIGNLDEDGCLVIYEPIDDGNTYHSQRLNATEEIAKQVGCEVEDVEDVLTFMQRQFEPVGVPFRTTEETLLLQAKTYGIDDPLVTKIIADHFEALKQNQIRQVAQALRVKTDDVLAARDIISTLDPFPGRRFMSLSRKGRSASERSIIPDVVLEKGDGGYKAVVNDSGMPRLRLNQFYINMMLNDAKRLDDPTKEFLENYRARAIDLLKNIELRRQTVARITEAVFAVQVGFLDRGVDGLKPLVRREIADTVGVHESTVSRATSSKYVQTPQGVYPLSFFFSAELDTDSGTISTTTVKDKIENMIAKENLAKPLSDQAISDSLGELGIHAARRTVAKYREQLGILSSSKRRRKWN